MAIKYLTDIDLNGNELQNVVLQSLSTAPTAVEGRIYYNTTDDTVYVYANGAWVDALSQGNYVFENGIQEDGSRNVSIKIATGDHAGNVAFTADSNGLAASVDLSGKVDKNDAITAGTHTKITYDTKGLVTAGADLEEADIPSLHLSKVTDITATAAEVNVLDGITATTAELNILDGVTATTTELNYVDGVTSSIQNQLDGKIDALVSGPTAGTYTKVTVTADGLVSAGNNLSESDIPDLHLEKITDVTATAAEVNVLDGITATTAELNILDGVTADASEINILDGATLTTTELNYVDGVTSSIQDQLNDKLELDSLSVAAGSADYMAYDNTSGEFSLSVDTTPTTDSTSLITSGGVKSYVDGKISTTYKAAGSVAFANLPTLGATYEGYVYNVSDAFTTTADFVEGAGKSYPAGTNVVCINTATSGAAVYKWDVLAGFVDVSSFITATSTDTLENKTIDADDNTISNLETDNFKSGVVVTSIAAASTAADTKLPTEKAIRTELDDKQDKVAAAVENNIASWDDAGNTKDSGKAFVTSVSASTSASDANIPTEKAVASFVESSMSGAKTSIENPALTVNSGVCSWSISGLAADPMSIVIIEKSTGDRVFAGIAYGTKSATISFNSAANIAEKTYVAKILM